MRKLIASFVTTMTLIIGVPLVVFSQESNHKQYGTLEGQTDARYEETSVETEPAVIKPSAKQDSVSRVINKKAPELQKPAAKKTTSEDEAPFNFLYYIIQRFKTSDIIED